MGCAGSTNALKGTNAADKAVMIMPQPNFVIKTTRQISGKKVFINVCTNEMMWPFPSILISELKTVEDNRGDKCQCIDIVIHPATLLLENENTVCLVVIRKVTKELVSRKKRKTIEQIYKAAHFFF